MRRILFGKLRSGTVAVEGISGDQVSGRLSSSDLLIIARSDCTVLVSETSHLLPRWRRSTRRRVQRLVERGYPGRIDETAYDYEIRRHRSKSSVVAVVLSRATLDAYIRRAGAAGLGVLCTLIRPRHLSAPVPECSTWAFSTDDSGFVELMSFAGGILHSSELSRATRTNTSATRSMERYEAAEAPRVSMGDDRNTETTVAPAGLPRAAREPEAAFVSLVSRLRRRGGRAELFDLYRPDRGRRRAVRRFTALFLVLTAASLLLELPLSSPVFTDARAKATPPQPERSPTPTNGNDMATMNRELGYIAARRPRRLYAVLEALQRAFPRDTLLRDLTLRGGELTLSLLSSEPMALVSALSQEALFTEVTMTESRRSDQSELMRVTVRGTLR